MALALRWCCVALLLTSCVLEAATPDEVLGVRVPVYKPLGLVSKPNKYGFEPGACSRALNVCMRDPGVISSLPDVRSYRADVISSGYTLRRLFAGDAYLLGIGDSSGTWAARWINASGSTTVTVPTGYTLTFDTSCVGLAITRTRQFLATDTGVLAFDSEADSSARAAGLPAPVFFSPSVDVPSTTDAQALPTDKACAYRALFRRKQSDGYEVVGPPSYAVQTTNTSGATIDPIVRVAWGQVSGSASTLGLIAGDFIDLYKTKTVDSGSSAGDTMYLAISHEITSTNISNNYAVITDTCPEDALRAELYTNPSQEGAENANMQPPPAKDAAVFKGYTFYASHETASSITTRVTSTVGTLTTNAERSFGIGWRTVTGTYTNASPTITGVSNTRGLAAGQSIGISGFAGTARILSVNTGASTVTMTENATSSAGPVSLTFHDRVEISGTNVGISSASQFADQEHDVRQLNVIFDQAIGFTYTSSVAVPGPDNMNGVGVTFQSGRPWTTAVTLRATNGSHYSPPLPDIAATAQTGSVDARTNRYHWSKLEQPEHVPVLSYAFVGNGTLLRMIPTRDALYMFCSDGLHRLSGEAGQWRVDPIDPNLILQARGAVGVLDGAIWAYTNEGLVSISDTGGIQYVSREPIGDLVTGAAFSATWDTFLACDELHHEVWLTFRSGGNSVSYVYNTMSGAFTTVDTTTEWSAMAYSRALQSLVIGSVSSNPDVLYFEADSTATRMGGAEVRFQPITGDGDAFTLKEFDSVTYLFQGFASAASLTPSFDGTNYTAVTIGTSSIENRVVVPVSRNVPAVAARIAPGFTFASGATTQIWSLRGVSTRFKIASEEGPTR